MTLSLQSVARRSAERLVTEATAPSTAGGDDAGSNGLAQPAEKSKSVIVMPGSWPIADDSRLALRGRSTSAIACLTSLILHATVVAGLVWSPMPNAIGSSGAELEAVSVDLVTAAALESLATRASAGGAAGPVADTPGIDAPAQEASEAADAPTPGQADPPDRLPPPPLAIVATPDPAPEVDANLKSAEIPAPQLEMPPTPPPEEPPIEPARKPHDQLAESTPNVERPPAKTAPAEAQAAVAMGGAVSRSTEGTVVAEGAAGASAGSLAKYALEVRLALGRARPSHNGARGRVLISFSLTATGRIATATVAKSSGTASADAAALAAVKRAAFPTPPAGSTDTQRSYTVPFEFK